MEKIYRVWAGYGKQANKWLSTIYVEGSAIDKYIEKEVKIVRKNGWKKRITFLIDDVGMYKDENKTATIAAYTVDGYQYNYKVGNRKREEERRIVIIEEAE
jgi:hypothetical protein